MEFGDEKWHAFMHAYILVHGEEGACTKMYASKKACDFSSSNFITLSIITS